MKRVLPILIALGAAIWLTTYSVETAPAPKPVPPPVVQAEDPDAAFLELAIPFVGRWEGLRLEAYLDPVGIPTVCYGETKGVKLGDKYTKAECDAMFARELLAYRGGVHRALTAETLARRLPVTRDVAYSSLGYNIGIGAVSKSTAVKRLNAGDVPGGCDAITWWDKAGGKVLRGLTLRRGEEYDLCMVGVR
ncbi:lysozyme [Sagittula sp. MA-2]|jgi:GH24 family phage-related lysozyme (muramidase)|uniref:lysozyme n=1 Tax=Sagittula sp. MA-2 TaxID=3048007 RepID=UPI0024C2EC49|nr:lysozyme [Sagittula sp. MA-2]WHZ35769.1 lysozyme [Sagittula sp. MA-2]